MNFQGALMDSQYISRKYLHLGADKDDVIYLNYKIKCTKTEYTILKVFVTSRSKYLTPLEIIEISGLNISQENVIYHISSINSKAFAIGGRKLVKNQAKKGYFLNEEM